MLPGFLDLFLALDLLDADIEQADGRPLDAEQRARHGRAHDGEIDELVRVGADRGADVEHDALAAHGRPDRGDRRAGRWSPWCAGRTCDIAISAPVLPAEMQQSACPAFTASIAFHMDDFQRPWRSAWLGLSSMRTAISQWMKFADGGELGVFVQDGPALVDLVP